MLEVVSGLDFGLALKFLKDRGGRINRAGWNGKGMYIEIQRPDTNSKMTLPYLYLKTADNNFVPWTPSQTDMLGDDWSWQSVETLDGIIQ